MPNWAYNKLVAEGPEADLLNLIAALESAQGDGDTGERSALDFERHLPTPETVLPDDRDAWAPARRAGVADGGWYEWRTAHWGTKWNAMWATREVSAARDSATYYFATAWAPPDPWLTQVARMHPKIAFTLEYVEEFCHFAGRTHYAGMLVRHVELSPDDIEWADEVEEEDE